MGLQKVPWGSKRFLRAPKVSLGPEKVPWGSKRFLGGSKRLLGASKRFLRGSKRFLRGSKRFLGASGSVTAPRKPKVFGAWSLVEPLGKPKVLEPGVL